jgi:hypothetical protein
MTIKENLLEIIWIIKTCLTTFWFWVPLLVGLTPVVEICVYVFINPLAIFVLPAVITAVALILDDRRSKARYRYGKPVGLGDEFIANWNEKQKVQEYLEVLDYKKKRNDSAQ